MSLRRSSIKGSRRAGHLAKENLSFTPYERDRRAFFEELAIKGGTESALLREILKEHYLIQKMRSLARRGGKPEENSPEEEWLKILFMPYEKKISEIEQKISKTSEQITFNLKGITLAFERSSPVLVLQLRDIREELESIKEVLLKMVEVINGNKEEVISGLIPLYALQKQTYAHSYISVRLLLEFLVESQLRGGDNVIAAAKNIRDEYYRCALESANSIEQLMKVPESLMDAASLIVEDEYTDLEQNEGTKTP